MHSPTIPPAPAPLAPADDRGGQSPNVLIIDDDPACRAWLAETLGGEGYSVLEAVDGPDGLRMAAEYPLDLVLLDRMMPHMGGLDVCRALKQADATRRVPVIIMTVLGQDDDVLAGLAAGASDYVPKPSDPAIVRARVRAALRAKLDADEIEQLADEVAAKNRKLAELAAAAERFVDDVSGELSRPLAVIRQFASIMSAGQAGAVTGRQREFLAAMAAAVGDLTGMVDDLLDSSRLRAGSLRVDRRALSVGEVLDSVRPLIAPKARARSIRLVERISPGLGAVFADRHTAGRVLLNLAVHAVTSSPEGGQVVLWARPGGSGDVEIGVTDRGPGLTGEKVAAILDGFRRAVMPAAGAARGLPLGLRIARELAWLNLGEIRLASRPGKGSTVSFTLPRNDGPAILARYFDRLGEYDRPQDRIAALRAAPNGPDADAERVREFLASTCRPMDLVVPAPDGRSVLAVGLAGEPDAWARGVRSAWAAAAGAGEPSGGLDVEHVGSWSYRRQKDLALLTLLEMLTAPA